MRGGIWTLLKFDPEGCPDRYEKRNGHEKNICFPESQFPGRDVAPSSVCTSKLFIDVFTFDASATPFLTHSAAQTPGSLILAATRMWDTCTPHYGTSL
ncbi:hypothetical protein DPEC_G00344710 [Dallia pectoralis]|uniref:Uncharacterized protein n=1 Tax=Dallia pectoralis TaxID=75939 RepID=A0ACC2F3A4_DALPE|nr:hypothetical protein DPEC_G00344710 [Dallia pectoralis]